MKLTTHIHLVSRSKNDWSYTLTSQYAFMAWCSVKAQGQLYLYFDPNVDDADVGRFVTLECLKVSE
jgi:hypothetical protein